MKFTLAIPAKTAESIITINKGLYEAFKWRTLN